jgi:lysophospholipase L1-like esterase
VPRLGRARPHRPLFGRAQPAAAAPLVSGTATFVDADTTQANLLGTAATGGTGSKTYRWMRASLATGPYSATGLTTLSAADTGISAGNDYWWYLEATDGASQVVTSNIVYGRLWQTPIILAGIGDSNMAGVGLSPGEDLITRMVVHLARLTKMRRITFGTNQGVAATTTATWRSDAGNGLLAAAVAAINAAAATDVPFMLGTNDFRSGITPAAAGANCTGDIFPYLLANCPTLQRIWWCQPIFSPDTLATSLAEAQANVDFQAVIRAGVNGTTIRLGDALGHEYTAWKRSAFQGDGLHLTAAGTDDEALLIANAIDNGLNVAAGGGGAAVFKPLRGGLIGRAK